MAHSPLQLERYSRSTPALRLLLLCVAAGALLTCCKTVYHPMSRLHRPVAINLEYANFAGVSLDLYCLPGPVLLEWDAEEQCRKLAQLFENQGAKVKTHTSLGRVIDPYDDPEETPPPEAAAADPAAAGQTSGSSLSMVLNNRLLHEEKSWVIPWVTTDYTFAEDIVIRDETGFLLVRETLTGRLVKRFGFFGDADEQLSEDYYGQLSQLLLNARMRRQVLGEVPPAAPAPEGGRP